MNVAIVGCALTAILGCAREETTMSNKPVMPAKHLSISIDRPPADVYAFAVEPENLPRWAKGLANSPAEVKGKDLVVDSPMGKVSVRFTERNELGILDHDVTMPNGDVVQNPIRVMPNGRGSEVVFSLFRRPGVDDAAYDKDAKSVQRDLEALKKLVEDQPPASGASK